MHAVLQLLARSDRSELADNRMTLFAPGFGLGSVHYWDGSWDNDSDGHPRQMREVFENRDGHLQVVDAGTEDILQQDYRVWHPHGISTRQIGRHQTVWQETKSIHQDVAVDVIEVRGGGLRKREVILRHFIPSSPAMQMEKLNRGVRIFCETGQYAGIYRVIGFAGRGPVEVRKVSGGWAVEQRLHLAPDRDAQTAYIVAAGENPVDTERRWHGAASHPKRHYERAHDRWADFFDRHVPAFDCDNSIWKKLYYFSFYVLRANLYDFRKGAIRHPYSCPSKWRLLPSWFWDPCFHGFSEKWLRDYPAPISTFRNHFESQDKDELGYLPMTVDVRGNTWLAMGAGERICQQFLHPMTVWDHYLVHGDHRVLHECLEPMVRHADYLWHHRRSNRETLFEPVAGGELADNSARLVADPRRRDQIQRLAHRIQPVDWNTFLLVSERLLSRIAKEINRTDISQRLSARANVREFRLRQLWSRTIGSYTDRLLPGRRLSRRRFAEGFLSMLGGYPTRAQVETMSKALLSSELFWTPFPIPTLPLTDQSFTCSDSYESYWNGRVWPNVNWGIIEGLCRMDQRSTARRLTHATLQMFVATGQPECTENYHPLSPGRYAPVHNIFNYGWGALGADLILRRSMGIQLCVPRRQVGLMPLGLPDCKSAAVKDLPFGKERISIQSWKSPSGHWNAKLLGRSSARETVDLLHWLEL